MPKHRPIAAASPLHPRHRPVLALLLDNFGIHQFYLGYYGAGAAYLLGTLVGATLLAFGGLALLFGSSGTGAAVAVLCGVILLGLGVWALVNTVRIITGDLKPKNGEYYPKFFQFSP